MTKQAILRIESSVWCSASCALYHCAPDIPWNVSFCMPAPVAAR